MLPTTASSTISLATRITKRSPNPSSKTITVDGDDLETSEMIQAGLHPAAQQVAANVEGIAANRQDLTANKQNIAVNKQKISGEPDKKKSPFLQVASAV